MNIRWNHLLVMLLASALLSCSTREREPEVSTLSISPADVTPIKTTFKKAIEYGQVSTVKYLLENGFDVSKRIPGADDRAGASVTYLEHAINYGKITNESSYRDIIRLILDYGSDVNAILADGTSILQSAMIKGDHLVVEMIIAHRDFLMPSDYSPYPAAVTLQDHLLLDILLENDIIITEGIKKQIILDTFNKEFKKEDSDDFSNDGSFMPMTKLLLEKLSIDINIKVTDSEYTLLMLAAKGNQVEAAEFFITAYPDTIDINQTDINGATALMHSVNAQDEATTFLLLNNCADKYIKNEDRQNACKFACQLMDKNTRKKMKKFLNGTYNDIDGNKCVYESRKRSPKCHCLPFGLGGFFF